MFRLPVCPHCGTIYRYKDTWSAVRKKGNVCYHCRKKFTAKIFPYTLIGAIVPLALCIVINILLLSRMEYMQMLPLFGVTLVFLLIIYSVIPFFTKFRKNENKSNKE